MIKAACHIHSEWSYDGKWSLKELATEFGDRGYQVLLMTEHDRGFNEARQSEYRDACAQASTADIFILPGIEYSDATNTVHILVWGPVPFLGEGLPTHELLGAAKAADGVTVLAHPSRRNAWKRFEPSWSNHLLGIEVWNRKTDGWAPSEIGFQLLRETQLMPFVGLDFHDYNQMFPLTINLDVERPLDEEKIVACLRARRFRPMAFHRPAEQVADGWRATMLKSAECCRWSLAHVYRSTKKLRRLL